MKEVFDIPEMVTYLPEVSDHKNLEKCHGENITMANTIINFFIVLIGVVEISMFIFAFLYIF